MANNNSQTSLPYKKIGGTIICFITVSIPLGYYPDEKVNALYDQWKASQDKLEKKKLKADYNEAAMQLNKHYNREVYSLI